MSFAKEQGSPPPPPMMGQAPGSMGAKLTGAARAFQLVRAMTGQAVGLAAMVFLAQAVLPEGRRPSDLLGGFHGGTERAELDAKREAQVQTARVVSNAQAAAPVMAQSLETQATAARFTDGACFAGSLLGTLFPQNLDAAKMAAALKQGCGAGDKIRRDMTRTLDQSARY